MREKLSVNVSRAQIFLVAHAYNLCHTNIASFSLLPLLTALQK